MNLQLHQNFDEVLEPLGNHAAEFFLAASLYHAHKISFAVAASLTGMGFEEFLARLREHFDTGFLVADESIEEDFATVDKIVASTP